MKVLASEPYSESPTEEIRFGVASWDDGSNTKFSVKLAWKDRTGKVCRGGEVPINALPQMQAMVRRCRAVWQMSLHQQPRRRAGGTR